MTTRSTGSLTPRRTAAGRLAYRFLVTLVLLPVMFYRRVLSPMKRTPTCRYLPTCSEYAIDAVKQRGIFVGIGLAFARLLRCHPFARGGFDPVPPRRCSHAHYQEQL